MTRILVGAVAVAALAALALSCDSSFFLRGTINGDCDPPRTIIPVTGGSDVATLRKSNCQPMGATCCRRAASAGRTSCQYPEDCYVAPFGGACATPVDCSDTQTCMGGTCQCIDSGPPCENLTTHVVTCCAVGQACVAGSCGAPLDGGV
ncbi:MAG TPA: hypothetical protein VF945_08335 [Polyangia bacterium]